MDAIRAKDIPQNVQVPHPKDAESILLPSKRTTFGVVEMTTGCGRRCRFCLPDLSPQMDLPKERILVGGPRQCPERKQADLACD